MAEDLEDFLPTIPFIRHEARSIVISLKMFEDSLDKTKTIDGNPLYKTIARAIRERALEIALWASALENEKVSDYIPPSKYSKDLLE